MRRILLLLFILSSLSSLKAQTGIVLGTVKSTANEPLIGAAVLLLNPADSTLIKGTAVDFDGNFTIANAPNGSYVLKITFLGYLPYLRAIETNNDSLKLGVITLQSNAKQLGSVNVVGKIPPVQLKGDTTQYNAGAFKTNPDATSEDLITKMPGITVVDGKVNAQGEEVKSVTVDGKQFFGDDASAVLKNLPAEVVDKIQVFDKKSEQSQFTGYDDGNTTKSINIVTKTQFRNGVFGRVYGGYGYDDKWRGGGTVNLFKDKRRITILANTNNINEQNFSSEDLLGVTSSGGGGTGGRGRGQGGGGRPGGGNSGDNFLVNQNGGITTTNALGLNYSNTWGKLEFTGSYFFNSTNNNVETSLFRTFISQQNQGLTYAENAGSQSTNINHRANMRFDWKIDSLNSILFQPKFTYQDNEGNSTLSGVNQRNDTLLSNTQNNYSSNLTAINFSAPLLYRHSFKAKKGRTLSLNLTPGYNNSKGNSNLLSYTNYFADTLATDSLNQLANLDKQGYVLSTNVTYTEPISKKAQLMFTYANNLNSSNSDRQTFNFSEIDNSYSRFDTTLSNTFNSLYHSESGGISLRMQGEKWNLMAGVNYQWAQLDNERQFPYQYNLRKTFNSVLPSAMYSYRFNPKKTLRIFYRSNNNAPSVDQLQDVINNSNPLQLSMGNSNLQQDFQNSLNLRYSAVNADKNTSFFALLSGTYTANYLGRSTYIAPADTFLAGGILLAEGSQLSMPTNLNGYYNLRSFLNYSFPISKIKSNLSFNGGVTYARTPGLINGQTNFANSTGASLGVVLSSNISDKVDFMLSSNSSYNNIANTLQAQSNSTFYNQNSRFKIQAQPWKGLVFQTDVSHQFYSGLASNLNQNFLLWNAAVGYKFLKDKAAELRLTVFDILKQNNSVNRNVTETYYEDTQTNVLQRYFMLTFTYNFKFYKGGSKVNSNSGGNNDRPAAPAPGDMPPPR
jgi:Outer membrane protein beta-barrel family/CarboxypepD_reg-like domain